MTFYARYTVTWNGNRGAGFPLPFPYLDKTHIKVKLNGAAYTNFTLTSDDTVVMTEEKGAGSYEVLIYRDTPTHTLARFADGTLLEASNLNLVLKQIQYVLEEARDKPLGEIIEQAAKFMNKWEQAKKDMMQSVDKAKGELNTIISAGKEKLTSLIDSGVSTLSSIVTQGKETLHNIISGGKTELQNIWTRAKEEISVARKEALDTINAAKTEAASVIESLRKGAVRELNDLISRGRLDLTMLIMSGRRELTTIILEGKRDLNLIIAIGKDELTRLITGGKALLERITDESETALRRYAEDTLDSLKAKADKIKNDIEAELSNLKADADTHVSQIRAALQQMRQDADALLSNTTMHVDRLKEEVKSIKDNIDAAVQTLKDTKTNVETLLTNLTSKIKEAYSAQAALINTNSAARDLYDRLNNMFTRSIESLQHDYNNILNKSKQVKQELETYLAQAPELLKNEIHKVLQDAKDEISRKKGEVLDVLDLKRQELTTAIQDSAHLHERHLNENTANQLEQIRTEGAQQKTLVHTEGDTQIAALKALMAANQGGGGGGGGTGGDNYIVAIDLQFIRIPLNKLADVNNVSYPLPDAMNKVEQQNRTMHIILLPSPSTHPVEERLGQYATLLHAAQNVVNPPVPTAPITSHLNLEAGATIDSSSKKYTVQYRATIAINYITNSAGSYYPVTLNVPIPFLPTDFKASFAYDAFESYGLFIFCDNSKKKRL
jgi:hypothetical protein|nr:MAG TPA: tail fiber protein [Caudoviricetes sp.]